MKSFRIFLESCKSINEAEYNKEWWDSKSDGFKKRYIERHPNSIYAQKSMGGKASSPKTNTSVKGVNSLLKGKSSASSDFEKAATVLLDKPQQTDAWMRKVNALAEHPYTPDSVIRRMEKEHPYAALHSPKASKDFLDKQIQQLDPKKNYTHMDILVQNPNLDEKQKSVLSKKLNSALSTTKDKYMKDRINWQLETLNSGLNNSQKKSSYKKQPEGGFFAMSKKDQADNRADFERLNDLGDKANRIKPKGENPYVISPKTLEKFNKEIGEFKKVQVPDGRTFYIGNYKPGVEKELADKVVSGKKQPDGMVIQMGDWEDHARLLGFTNPKSAKSWYGKDYTREENKLKQGDSYYKELSKKFPVGKTVNPDSPRIPDDVIVDDDGVIVGYSK